MSKLLNLRFRTMTYLALDILLLVLVVVVLHAELKLLDEGLLGVLVCIEKELEPFNEENKLKISVFSNNLYQLVLALIRVG